MTKRRYLDHVNPRLLVLIVNESAIGRWYTGCVVFRTIRRFRLELKQFTSRSSILTAGARREPFSSCARELCRNTNRANPVRTDNLPPRPGRRKDTLCLCLGCTPVLRDCRQMTIEPAPEPSKCQRRSGTCSLSSSRIVVATKDRMALVTVKNIAARHLQL